MEKKVLLPVLLVLIGSLVYVQVGEYKIQQKVLGVAVERKIEISKLENRRDYWKEIVTDSPTYRDGYVQLAVISYQLDNYEEARMYLRKVLEIDPNWEVPPLLSSLLDPQ